MQQIYTLARLTGLVKHTIENQAELQNIWVDGEISNLTIARSGHAYFSLKDADAQFRCVMWKSAVTRQRAPMREGDRVLVHGNCTVYAPRGEIQLQADLVQPQGTGLLQLQLEELRMRLEAEGLFDETRKRPLPPLPKVIGVVTAETGAVWHDIQRVVGRRYPLAELVLSPTLVQGDSAPEAIVSALQRLQERAEPDVIIIGRGGGSMEDLWAFNDERVIRVIFASRVPIISAVGHENDFTLADDVADVRAGTPSMAAELATPNVVDIDGALADIRRGMLATMERRLNVRLEILDDLQRRLSRVSPASRLSTLNNDLSGLSQRIRLALSHRLAIASRDVDGLQHLLGSLSPEAMFTRGFAFVENATVGTSVRSIDDVSIGDTLRTSLRGGTIESVIDTLVMQEEER